MSWPWWLVVLVIAVGNWPVALGVGAGLLIVGLLAHRWLRWAALVAALPFLAVIAVAAWWCIDR